MHAAVSLSLSLLVPIASLWAQVQPPVEPGARVRVMACQEVCATHEGAFTMMTADSVVLAVGDRASRLALPLASVAQIEAQTGRKSGAGAGAILGGIVLGASATYLGAIAIGAWGACEYSNACEGAELKAIGTGLAGAGVGALLGATIGSAFETERWEEVPLDQLRVSLGPQRDGRLGIGFSVAF